MTRDVLEVAPKLFPYFNAPELLSPDGYNRWHLYSLMTVQRLCAKPSSAGLDSAEVVGMQCVKNAVNSDIIFGSCFHQL